MKQNHDCMPARFARRSVFSLIGISLFSLCFLARPVTAQLSNYGFVDYSDPGFAAETLLQLAEIGDPRAAYLLGMRFYEGHSGQPDEREAARWFRRAAEDGLPEAQFRLGEMYAAGKGVPQDKAQSAIWYRKALNQGVEAAQAALAGLKNIPTVAAHSVAKAESEAASPEAPVTSAAVMPAPARPTTGASQTRAGSWVSGLSPSALTAQVASFKDEQEARAFLKRYLTGVAAGIHPSQRNGTRWYAVFVGEFENRTEAVAAVAKLPERVRNLKPWIRSVAKVQARMAAN